MRLSIRTAANRWWRPSAAVGLSATSSAVLASMIAAHSVADRSGIQSKRAFSLGLSSPDLLDLPLLNPTDVVRNQRLEVTGDADISRTSA
jgi:hypothetical protein